MENYNKNVTKKENKNQKEKQRKRKIYLLTTYSLVIAV